MSRGDGYERAILYACWTIIILSLGVVAIGLSSCDPGRDAADLGITQGDRP